MPSALEGGPRATVLLSLVIPAFNEEARFPLALPCILESIDREFQVADVFVVTKCLDILRLRFHGRSGFTS